MPSARNAAFPRVASADCGDAAACRCADATYRTPLELRDYIKDHVAVLCAKYFDALPEVHTRSLRLHANVIRRDARGNLIFDNVLNVIPHA
jgi:hypothetical protein